MGPAISYTNSVGEGVKVSVAISPPALVSNILALRFGAFAITQSQSDVQTEDAHAERTSQRC